MTWFYMKKILKTTYTCAHTQKLLELINEYNTIAGYKINV